MHWQGMTTRNTPTFYRGVYTIRSHRFSNFSSKHRGYQDGTRDGDRNWRPNKAAIPNEQATGAYHQLHPIQVTLAMSHFDIIDQLG